VRAISSLRITAAAGLTLALLAGCSSTPASPPTSTSPATRQSPTPVPTSSGPATPTPNVDNNGATAAPSWLGHRVLAIGPDGFGVASTTPPELRDRRIITTDLLPPPADGGFHSQIVAVPADVVRRSSWSAACPVSLSRLRYVNVSFRGFDGRAHTGELLVNRSVATKVVTVFRRLFAASWPIEEMRITSNADLSAAPTGDGNDTSAFACRPVRGATVWSQHAYGLAIDVDPFDNPYVDGRTVLPELARSYADRSRKWPGVITPGSVPVLAFRSVGWGWGGNYSSKKDWMHFSSTGK
jgi:D-alanyl-D-alanine carboxypeptidase